MTSFEIKGWCPGALRPMMSGDGFVVRVRPRAGRITAEEACGIAKAARDHGSGVIDVSSRANLQIRGVRPESHASLLGDLARLGVLDVSAAVEARRNIVVTPFWRETDGNPALALSLATSLEIALAASDLALPGKFGFAADCGPERVLASVSTDIRIEQGRDGRLMVRPEGAELGVPVEPDDAAGVALEFARWFIASGGVSDGRGRMAPHIRNGAALPAHLAGSSLPVAAAEPAKPGLVKGGALVAIAFGSMTADTLEGLACCAAELCITPWRMIFLPGAARMPSGPELITEADDPLLRVEACTGAPWCPQAQGETRSLARLLAAHVPQGARLHVSGCAKGCAHPKPSPRTLVATAHGFDLVRNGSASDRPVLSGLRARDIAADPIRTLGGLSWL